MKSELIAIIFSLTLFSCTSEKIDLGGCPEIDNCLDIPISTSFIGYQENMLGVQYSSPCFNPNNSNEFVYFQLENQSGSTNYKLSRYNIQTNENQTILENVLIVREPIWTIKNEIYFWHHSGDIYRINPDGSNLENVTNRSNCSFPSVSGDGNKLYFRYNPNNQINIGLIINTETLETIDTTSANACSDWSDTDFLATGEGSSFIGIQNSTTDEHHMIYDYNIPNYSKDIWDIKFSMDNKYLFYCAYTLGIHKVNIDTKENSQIKLNCDNRDFRSLSMHPNGKQMLVQLVKIEKINETRLDVSSEIWLMKVDGCDSFRILP
jgi:hypothetical protein